MISNAESTHDPNDFFTIEYTDPGGRLFQDVHASSATNAWAVGDAGLIASRTTGIWQQINTLPITAQVESVWTSGTTFTAVVTRNFTQPFWITTDNGASWTNVPLDIALTFNSISQSSLYGISPTDVWIYFETGSGIQHFFYHYTGGATADLVQTFPGCDCSFANGKLAEMWARAVDDFWWANGEALEPQIEVLRGNGIVFTPFSTPMAAVRSVWGSSTTDYWLVDAPLVGGTINRVHYDGTTFDVTEIVDADYLSLSGSSSSDIWLGGTGGRIEHYDGTQWTLEPTVTSSAIDAIHMVTSGVGYMVAGDDILVLDVNPTVALPVLTGLQWDPSDLYVHTSEAQCLGDEVTIGINMEPSLGMGGFANYVINSDSGIVVEQIPTTSFFNLNNKHLHTSRIYPAGTYTFLVTADVNGLLAPDNWAAETFSVPKGTCLDSNQDGTTQRLETIEANLTQIISEIDVVVNQTIGDNLLEIILQGQSPIAMSLDTFFWLTLIVVIVFIHKAIRGVWATAIISLLAGILFAFSFVVFEGLAIRTLAAFTSVFVWFFALTRTFSKQGNEEEPI